MAAPKRKDPDRSLVPVAVANRLGVGVSVLAGWMRAPGVDKDGPLRESAAAMWRANPDSAPVWLHGKLLATYQARGENQKARMARESRLAVEHRDAVGAAYDLVLELLRTDDRKLRQGHWLDRHPVHEEALQEIAWRAAKDCGLASSGEPDFTHLSIEERRALRIFGYEVPEPAGRHLKVLP